MLVIYIDKQTNRLGYTINLIFKELLQVDYMITTSRDQFIALEGAKLSYCDERIYDEIHISKGSNILFETNIYSLDIDYIFEDGIHKIFRTYNNGDTLGFDIFAATFYMVSRYEEYLPFIRDEHFRFRASDSIASKYGFLQKPVVNIWAKFLQNKLSEKYKNLNFKQRSLSFINTIDIDQAFSYKHKNLYRTIGGMLRDLSVKNFESVINRIKVIFGFKKDPYNSFSYILQMITKYNLNTVLFFLFGEHSKYDKNNSPYNTAFRTLIKKLSDYAEVGIHPSYYSIEFPYKAEQQTKQLAKLIHKNITCSRFHYLRFALPQSYNDVINNGISEEYSMGYSDNVGFRAGICSPYKFYNLDKDCETKLRIHPFMFMDVTLKNSLKLSVNDASALINLLIEEVSNVGGEFISIWHNESLSEAGEWYGWRDVFHNQVQYIKSK